MLDFRHHDIDFGQLKWSRMIPKTNLENGLDAFPEVDLLKNILKKMLGDPHLFTPGLQGLFPASEGGWWAGWGISNVEC